MKKVFKAGEQSANDPMEFVMSTADVDRMGDIVEQDWVLQHFKKNPIALYQHNSSVPIGVWENVRVEAGKLLGRLRLAAAGTSELIDTIRSLVEQRILKAVSVGFRPGKYDAMFDSKGNFQGYRLSNNELMECSLVSVPANQFALATGKALDSTFARMFVSESGDPQCALPACVQLGVSPPSRVSEKSNQSSFSRSTTMTLAERIKAKQQELAEKRALLTELTATVDDNGIISEETQLKIDEVTSQIEKGMSHLSTLESAERALAERAAPANDGSGRGPVDRIEMTIPTAKGHRAFATMAMLIKAHVNRINPVDIAKAEFRGKTEYEVLLRAATDPATTGDAAWAGPLVRQTWGEYLDLIRDISVYPRLPGIRVDFDAAGKVVLPKNTGRGKLSGGFVAEGAPIPVKEGAFGSTDLTPKKMAVISSFTKELARHSTPTIESVLRSQILEDTAETLDTLFLDAEARTAIRPAGMQDATETGAGNINASTGNTVAAITADATAMLGRAMAARAGSGGVWVMNPLRALELRNLQDAASGQFVFRSEIAAGTFMGYPLITSLNVAETVVMFMSSAAMAYGNDYSPMIDVSDQATLHFEDTAPLQINGGTPASPVRSLWQTDSIALKMTVGMDWRLVRKGGVQILTDAWLA